MENVVRTKQCGNLIVISGPSGSGKGTIISKLLENNDNVWLSISMTSRGIRANDVPNVTYFFVSKDEFEKKINEGVFLENIKNSTEIKNTVMNVLKNEEIKENANKIK